IWPSKPSPTEFTNRSGAPARRSPTISWGYQAARCSGSVTARHTFSRECASLRVKVSVHRSPSRVSVPRAASSIWPPGVSHVVEMGFRLGAGEPDEAPGRQLDPPTADVELAGVGVHVE